MRKAVLVRVCILVCRLANAYSTAFVLDHGQCYTKEHGNPTPAPLRSGHVTGLETS